MERNVSDKAEIVLSISGMTCSGCAQTLTRVLSRVPGVTDAMVDFQSGRASIAGNARAEDLIAAVEAAGYGAQPSTDVAEGERHERARSGCC